MISSYFIKECHIRQAFGPFLKSINFLSFSFCFLNKNVKTSVAASFCWDRDTETNFSEGVATKLVATWVIIDSLRSPAATPPPATSSAIVCCCCCWRRWRSLLEIAAPASPAIASWGGMESCWSIGWSNGMGRILWRGYPNILIS